MVKKVKLLSFFLLAFFFLAALPARAEGPVLTDVWQQPARADLRAHRLAKFLGSYQSPLAPLADDFVFQADYYGLDYRLLPAIAGVESTFGRAYIPGTYNVYGWARGQMPFDSWVDGIARVAAGLRKNYLNKGAQSIDQIAFLYDPPGAASWAKSVQFFMDKITQTPVYQETADGITINY